MRRNEREITDKTEIIKVTDKCDVCRVALSHNNVPYIVPMNFGYEYADGRLILYFHCAKEGRKLDIIKENSAACFEMDCSHNIISGEKACNYSMEYESVIGNGNIVIVGDGEIEEKRRALDLIMKKYAPEKSFEFSEANISSVTILKLNVREFTGKRHVRN
ncbi:MAG: pyridoxamine 5'-phosphate oxidase family protein [Oscillospiraceae bacterium]|nr:pyridoxamine 5'-phosphate oxidase family protein [Oscillospiraceae bacterium]